jgi:biopolymer transport protein TolQ
MNTFLAVSYATSEGAYVPYQTGWNGVLGMVFNAGAMVKFILAGLLCLSIACWCIIALKLQLIRRARKHSEQFIALFRERKGYTAIYRDSKPLDGYLAEIFRAGHEELNRMIKATAAQNSQELAVNPGTLLENVDRAMQGGMTVEKRRFERFLPFLATTGSTAPFIGLFGTVWGIMTSFQQIGMKGAANLAVVAPGISEALIATAMGLAAAIPAVIAYNHFSNSIKAIEGDMNQFSTDYLNMLKRDLIRRGKQEET